MDNKMFGLKAMLAGAALAAFSAVSGAAVTTFGAVGEGVERTNTATACSTGDCVIKTLPGSGNDLVDFRNDFENAASLPGFTLSGKKYERFSMSMLPGVRDDNALTDTYSIFGGTGSIVASRNPGVDYPTDLTDSLTAGTPDNDVEGPPLEPNAVGFAGRWDTSDNADATWFEFYLDLTIHLGGDYTAFGFYMTDLSDAGATIDVMLGDSPTLHRVSPTSNGAASVIFFGLYSDDAFNKVTLRISNIPGSTIDDVDIAGLDDIVVGNLTRDGGQPIPEPSALALIGLGLLVAGRRARRSKA